MNFSVTIVSLQPHRWVSRVLHSTWSLWQCR